MVHHRPHPLRSLLLILATIALALALSACGSTRSPLLHQGHGINVEFSHRDGIAGRWDHDRSTIYLSAHTNRWTLAHELAHAADSLAIPYSQAVAMLGPCTLNGMDIVRRVNVEARRIGGPLAHWKALRAICGPQAVHHDDILARISDLYTTR